MSSKDTLLQSMLQSTGVASKPVGPLISEIGTPEEVVPTPIISPPLEEGPTMLELMMAAQAEAKKEKDVAIEVEKKKTTKTFGSGFKKGFFGGESKAKVAKPQQSGAGLSSTSSTPQNNQAPIVTITKKAEAPAVKSATLVLDEVQEAMKADENPMLQQLKGGGKSTFTSNIQF